MRATRADEARRFRASALAAVGNPLPVCTGLSGRRAGDEAVADAANRVDADGGGGKFRTDPCHMDVDCVRAHRVRFVVPHLNGYRLSCHDRGSPPEQHLYDGQLRLRELNSPPANE